MNRVLSNIQLIGSGPVVARLRDDIETAARSNSKVLITGETGAGKEVVARLIHSQGPRRLALLTTMNCAGVPDSLLESELFGHVRGSFTGAYRDKPGLLESAANGTVFLDEVGEMSTRMQAVLLRFLETGELQRVGADRPHTRVSIRIIAATNRDLMSRVAEGAFREDLYYRLNVIHIAVPPLRERRDDIPALVNHFMDLASEEYRVPRPQLSAHALEQLCRYDWPGNVRQVKNVVERLLLMAWGRPIGSITAEDLPAEILPAPQPIVAASEAGGRNDATDEVGRDFVYRILERGESFWAAVYPVFMSRDMTRETLRQIVSTGLERTSGNYRMVVELFNMPQDDYKRFLSFLRKHDCQVPFRSYRVPPQIASEAPTRGEAFPQRLAG